MLAGLLVNRLVSYFSLLTEIWFAFTSLERQTKTEVDPSPPLKEGVVNNCNFYIFLRLTCGSACHSWCPPLLPLQVRIRGRISHCSLRTSPKTLRKQRHRMVSTRGTATKMKTPYSQSETFSASSCHDVFHTLSWHIDTRGLFLEVDPAKSKKPNLPSLSRPPSSNAPFFGYYHQEQLADYVQKWLWFWKTSCTWPSKLSSSLCFSLTWSSFFQKPVISPNTNRRKTLRDAIFVVYSANSKNYSCTFHFWLRLSSKESFIEKTAFFNAISPAFGTNSLVDMFFCWGSFG